MTLGPWLAFVAASAVLLVIPGPTILTVLSYSLAHGRRATVPIVAGVAIGDVTALAVSLLGLGSLLAASAFWFNAVKWAGGLYLLFLGVGMLRAGASPAPPGLPVAAGPASRGKMFANTWLVTALNPKGMVFFVAFLPQFIDPAADVAYQSSILALTFVVMATVNAALYASFAAAARQALSSPGALRGLHVAGGSLLSAAGVWALLARRAA